MKLTILALVTCFATVYGQERIYLVTRSGGPLNGGTLLSFNPEGNDAKIDLSFGNHFVRPRHLNIKGPDEYLYGLTYGGNVAGGIFRVKMDGTAYEQVFHFGNEIGISDGAIAISSEGVIYGTTSSGGTYGSGNIFSLNKDGSGFKKIHEFTWGLSNPSTYATIVVGSDGSLYGTNHLGSSSSGCIYSINQDGSGFREVLKFNSANLGTPAGLVQGKDGKLYGLCRASSSSNAQLFRVNTDGTGFHSLLSFPSGDPGYGIYEARNGRIYGMLTENNGAIFSSKPDGSDYQVIHTFNVSEGANPSPGIFQASDGFLYGQTEKGGDHNLGVAFRMQEDGSDYEVINHSSIGSTSSIPYVDEDGTVYGFTSEGGEHDKGTLLKIVPGMEEVVYSFGAPDSTAYSLNEGVTEVDGTFVMFAMPQNVTPINIRTVGIDEENTFITHSLPVTTNSSGISRPIKGQDGFLYATTPFGGANSQGLLFKTKADGSMYAPLHDFTQDTGVSPFGEVLVGLDGRLYGTCFQGGNTNSGVIYAINKDGSGFTVLHHFAYPTGQIPLHGLIQDSNGIIYGCAKNIFRINPDGTNYQQLHAFQSNETPGGELVLMGKYVYGCLTTGGSASKGAVFRIRVDGSDYRVVHNFTGIDGERPYSGMLAYAGSLFGATSLGGSFGYGTIFRLSATGDHFTKIMDLSHMTGGMPSGDLTGKCVTAPKPEITLENGMLMSNASIGNQWYRDGVMIPGANDTTYEPTASGFYSVASNLNDCPGQRSDGQLVNITSLEKETHNNIFKVYPNPTNKHIYIDVAAKAPAIRNISISDAMGNIIVNHHGEIKQDWQFDMSPLATGVYILRVSHGSTYSYTKIIRK